MDNLCYPMLPIVCIENDFIRKQWLTLACSILWLSTLELAFEVSNIMILFIKYLLTGILN